MLRNILRRWDLERKIRQLDEIILPAISLDELDICGEKPLICDDEFGEYCLEFPQGLCCDDEPVEKRIISESEVPKRICRKLK